MFGERLFTIILPALKTSGSYDPDQNMHMIGELLTREEYDKVESFLAWVHAQGKTFGRGNYEEVYQQYLANKKA